VSNALPESTLAQPEGEGLTYADLLPANPPNITTTMAMQYRSAWREGVEDGWNEARDLLARWGRPAAPAPLPANYIDPEHQGEDLELLQTFYQACQSEGGTADEIHLRGIRAVLAARPAAPPAPVLADAPRNPTMDEVLDLAKSLQLEVNDCDALLWLVVTAIAAWGDASAAPQAPGVREVGLLVDRLNQVAGDFDFLCNKALETAGAMRRAATLLQQFSAITTEDLKND